MANLGTKDPTRQAIWIVLRDHNDPDGRYQVKEQTCQDWTDARGHEHKGCGGTVWRYVTHPGGKAMRFDGPLDIVPGSEDRLGSQIIALVYTENVHWATCTARVRRAPVDGKAAAAGIS